MNYCEKYLNLIDDLIEGELDERNAGRVNSHLLACPPCAAYRRTAEREKEIYARYLSNVEPPADLLAKFQANIIAESQAVSPVPATVAASGWKTKFSGFFRLSPAFGLALALVALGIGMSKLLPSEAIPANESLAKAAPENVEETFEINKIDSSALPPAIDHKRAVAVFSKLNDVSSRNESLSRKTNSQTANKILAIKTQRAAGRKISGDKIKNSPIAIQPDEEEFQRGALEKAAARQIEKTELLFRSFRNARLMEDSPVYDIAYETQQARRLLEKNVQLRRIAENNGDFYTEEILDKAEWFLLDIANLENNPSPEKISDIKERLKNQNIIASLQVY